MIEGDGFRGSRFMAPGCLLLAIVATFVLPVAAAFVYTLIYPR